MLRRTDARSRRGILRVGELTIDPPARAAPKIQLVVALLLVPSVLLLVAAAVVAAFGGGRAVLLA